MAINDYYKQYMDQMMEYLVPSMQKQQEGIYDYLMQLGQRQGIPEAMRRAGEAVSPYASASGDAAAKAGAQATRMAQQQDQYEKELAQRQAEWEKQVEMWEKSFAEQQEQNDWNQMWSAFEQTGWTPELMQAMGYGGYTQDAFGATGYEWGSGSGTNSVGNNYTGYKNGAWYNDGVKYGTNHPAAYL